MATAKIAITMDADTVRKSTGWWGSEFSPTAAGPSGGRRGKLARMDKNRLARECAKLDPRFELTLAEEGIHMETSDGPNTEDGRVGGRSESRAWERTGGTRPVLILSRMCSMNVPGRDRARHHEPGTIGVFPLSTSLTPLSSETILGEDQPDQDAVGGKNR